MYSIANGMVLNSIWPNTPHGLANVDPVLNVDSQWPPVCIVHGTADIMVPPYLSRSLETALRQAGVETEFVEVKDEPHTFVGRMSKGSPTWKTQLKGVDFLQRILERSYEEI
jgi:dipeptidyl aminopeptidase/acylaminoacyl peptidase